LKEGSYVALPEKSSAGLSQKKHLSEREDETETLPSCST
jgi:hypothetical protein